MSETARYTFTEGTRAEGVVVYDNDTKIQIYNDSCIARGQHNAWDLVRLHLFGGLDDESSLDLPVTQRPSYKEMVRLATNDPVVQDTRALNEFEDLEDPVLEADPPAKEAMARPLSLVLTHPTAPRWLIRDELERGVMALMAGPRGSYKSFKALHWAMTCATRGEPVYVVSAEGGDFERRAAAWLLHHGVLDPPPLYVVERRLDLNSKAGVESIRQDCLLLKIRPVLFVLDTFSKLSGGLDENDNSQVKQFIGRLDNGLKRPDAFDSTVLLVAHTGHADTSRARGASALEADTDAAYIVHKDAVGGTVRITRERFKSSSELPPLVYQPKIVDLGRLDDDGLPVTSLILERADGVRQMLGKQPAGKNQKHVYDVLTELGPVTAGRLLDVCVERLPFDSGSRDLRRQYSKQALEALVGSRLVYIQPGNVVSTSPVIVTEDWLE